MAGTRTLPCKLRTSALKVPTGLRTYSRSCKSKLAVLLKRAQNMSNCSHESRTLLVAMKNQLSFALEERNLTTRAVASGSEPQVLYSTTVTCSNCEGFMVQPVCMPCGHSVCKGCTDKSTMLKNSNLVCPKCNYSCPKIPQGFSPTPGEEQGAIPGAQAGEQCRTPTLTLQNAFRKWYPMWVESCRCREEGNKYANQGDFPLATQWYTQALETGVCDYRVLGNRSRSYLAMDKLGEAYEDAELACQLNPFWAKGHYRRGAVLEKQGRWQEAVAAYLLCLHLGGSDQSVFKAACQLLDQNMSAAEKQTLSREASQGGGEGGSSSCSETVPSSEKAHCLSFGSIIQMAVGIISECAETEESFRQEMNAVISPVPSHLVNQSDFECVLCTSLLYCPVTTPCGHSFCQSCLCRSFDHCPTCPICRAVLDENFQQHCRNLGKMNVDQTLEGVLLHYFHSAYMDKRAQQSLELERSCRVGTSETETLPVFVCTMAYPTLPCPLHVFEPRYRLMIRRCMESGRRFGMCSPAEEEGGSDISFATFGTVLHIDSLESVEDGRFLLSSTGERRFKVLGRSITDGYHIAQIMFLFDERVTNQEEISSLRALQLDTYNHARKWLDSTPFFSKVMMMQVMTTPLPDIDPVPECCPNGPKWVWWFVHSLPMTPTKKLDFLKCTSLKERLLMLKQYLPLHNTSN